MSGQNHEASLSTKRFVCATGMNSDRTNVFARKLRSAVLLCAKRVKSFRITVYERYERCVPPEVDGAFAEWVRSDDSIFSSLLTTNHDVVQQAEMVLRRQFRVLSLKVDAEHDSLDWHKDFVSGARYPQVPYPRIQVDFGRGRDVIIVWEFSRLQFIPTLIQAHRVTGDNRYVACFQSIVDDWIDNNPYLIGINWWTGMEVAIRAINLHLGLLYFGEHLGASTARYWRVLWAHAKAIYDHDFKRIRSQRNNHFLVSAVGLLGICLFFRGGRAAAFFKTAKEHFELEVLRQFREDGGNFESAVHYHQLSLEAALIAVGFLADAREAEVYPASVLKLKEEVCQRLVKAVTLVADYTHAFGCSPQFGDSSDGRIVLFRDYFGWDPRDHGFIESLARMTLGGQISFPSSIKHSVYTDSGYGFFRNDSYGLCLCASSVADAGHGGHNHCDKTSVVLQVKGQPVFVDSGTFSYPDLLSRYRHKQSRSHNIVVVDRHEQGGISEQRVFGRPEGIEPRIGYTQEQGIPTWTMEHNGYARFDGLGRTCRIVQCREQDIEVEDRVHGGGEHLVEIAWNVHPSVSVDADGREVRLSRDGEILCRLEVPDQFDVLLERSCYSPEYGVDKEASRIVMSRRAGLPLSVRYAISVRV